MNYLKRFESYKTKIPYYKIFIDKSFDKFVIALEKLGIKEKLFDEWHITDNEYAYEYIIPENKKYFEKDILYLTIIDDFQKYKTDHYCVVSSINDITEWIDDTDKLEYKGEIHVENYELTAKRYNL